MVDAADCDESYVYGLDLDGRRSVKYITAEPGSTFIHAGLVETLALSLPLRKTMHLHSTENSSIYLLFAVLLQPTLRW
jgi:hypothetical protein